MTQERAWLHVALLLLAPTITFLATFSVGAAITTLCLELAWIVWQALNERWPRLGYVVRREFGMTTNNINHGR